MALLFQSNPDEWDLRGHMYPGRSVSWYVSRYQTFTYHGALVLLWEAQGHKPKAVRGLYGWGVTIGDVQQDAPTGRMRIPLRYTERWRRKDDEGKEMREDMAPISAHEVLSLGAWENHLLNLMPIGTNFLVTLEQLDELITKIVKVRFPKSRLYEAFKLESNEECLDASNFVTPKPILEGEE